MYRDEIHEGDKGFTSSDEENRVTEDGIEDNGCMNYAASKRADVNKGEDGIESSQRNSPGVLSDSAELECDKTFIDTQYLNEYEETENVEGTTSNATEDGEEEIEHDAQSLGLNSSQPEIEPMGEDAPSVTEEQSDANRGSGM